ncbi:hypothetical protein O181_093473 [Austropuccinia psidii MF-1]|uniref:Uncharacterized protein n=1 Tax=Austropuccinia psidii MF-1 TaxID=1389203 RepID=A0A9Q3P9C4_9BASI|nr:hypothetical protein [Austropuccinia psidii MF-1]
MPPILTLLRCPQDMPPKRPSPTHQLPSLHSRSVLPTCLQCCSHTGLILNATYHPYALKMRLQCRPHHSLRLILSPPLTILMLRY